MRYVHACGETVHACSVSNLVRLHQSTVYYQNLLQLINGVFIPNLKALLTLGKQNEVNLEQLDKQIDHYKVMHLSALMGFDSGLLV